MPDQPVTEPDGPSILEFVAPFPLSACIQRLQGRHERPAMLAWDWQTRLQVEIATVDAHTRRFRLRRVGKSYALFYSSFGEVRGYLRALEAGRTLVIAEPHVNRAGLMVLATIFAAIFTALLAEAFAEGGYSTQDVTLLVAAFTALAISLLAGTWWWVDRQVRGLVGALQKALGYLEPDGPPPGTTRQP